MGTPVRRARDRIGVELVLGSGVVVSDGESERPVGTPRKPRLATGETWMLAPGASTQLVDGHLRVSFDLLPDQVRREHGQICISRTRRTVEVDQDPSFLACLVDLLSSGTTLEELVSELPHQECDAVHDVVADLVEWGAVVAVKGARPRLAHAWSMRGAMERGRLSPVEIAELTFNTRAYGDETARVVELDKVRPFPVDSLAAVLRGRRSPTCYDSSPISVEEVAQLLGGACGVTGELVLGDRSVPLRSYPSPGALYAVDVYLIPARVEGLEEGVFRYDPPRHALVAVRDQSVDPVSFCLPDVRTVVEGVAAFIALTICLARATPKYGDESYRILVAEAGCIAENLILVAHALGLRAGPFTGVFDYLVDQALGVDVSESSFVVGVLVGREGSRA